MIPEIDYYLKQIKDLIVEVDVLEKHTFETLSKKYGNDFYTTEQIKENIEVFKSKLIEWKDPKAPERYLIMEDVIQKTENIIKDFKSFEAQIDFANINNPVSDYDYLAKVNKAFISFVNEIWNICKFLKLDATEIPCIDIPDIREDESKPKKKKAKAYKLFEDYFHDKRIPTLCKKIFESGSPKGFAIMFSLLVKKDLLTIPDRKRRDYYKSWYEYIGKDFPDRDNFTAINQHLNYESNKLCFDESDIDYINYSKNFDKRTSKMILS